MLGLTTTTKKTLAGGGGPSLVIQWLKRQASNAESVGLIPGGGIKIPCATWCSQKTEKETTVPSPPQKMKFLLQRIFFNSNYEGKWTIFFKLKKKFFLAVLYGI